jgi:DNA polymerase (family 10)
MYFTGSKAHNIALRGRAVKKRLLLNEYGLFREGDSGDPSKNIPCRDEAAIYKVFDLPYIEPELREDTGEIEAAVNGELPDLIEEPDLQGLLHVHTTWSDGTSTINEMAQAAVDMGLKYLGITDHSQSALYAHGLTPERVREQRAAIEEARAKFKGKITLFHGIESDILPDGSLDYPDEILASFDYVVAAIHSSLGLGEAAQTTRLVKALSHPSSRILAHPTGRLLLARDPYAVNLTAVYEAAAAYKVAVEINAHPHRLDLDWRECRAAREKGCLFSINPDAHNAAELAFTRFGVGVARKGWLSAADVINAMGLPQIRSFLKGRGV